MCGILGSRGIALTAGQVGLLAHRGPDSKGEVIIPINGNDIWLAHTRLSILDLSPAGHQPMQSRDGRWWITFNGEIYNHLDLRNQLTGSCRGHSDTETLIEIIATQGISKVLPKLNGMYAFAALDTLEGKLYLARDPFGIKPLYYYRLGKTFAFASEVRILKALGISDGWVDEEALQLFLTLRYVPSPKTLWHTVNRLQPGHVLCVNIESGDTDLQRYTNPVSTRFSGTLEDATNVYRGELHKAIKRQLLSDVPVGVLLSGGIDSALVAAMAKDAGHELPCFSVGYGAGHDECEIADAAKTAKVLGLPFSSVVVTPIKLQEALLQIVKSVEEPIGTTSIMPMWFLVQKAREDVTVVLTGQGTDEPWGGYRRYQVEMIRRMLPWTGFWHVAKWMASIANVLPEVVERGLRTLPVSDMAHRMVEACALFNSSEREMLTGCNSDGGASQAMEGWLDWLNRSNCEPAEQMMRVDSRMNLADDLLLYGDKISMAVSLEARVPMLDIELVRFVESLPLDYRVALRRTKIVHKLMAERYLPNAIVHRKKKGFQVPFGEWSRRPWRKYVEDTLLTESAPHWALLKREGVKKLWVEHLNKKPDRSRQIFSLLILSIWWKNQCL